MIYFHSPFWIYVFQSVEQDVSFLVVRQTVGHVSKAGIEYSGVEDGHVAVRMEIRRRYNRVVVHINLLSTPHREGTRQDPEQGLLSTVGKSN